MWSCDRNVRLACAVKQYPSQPSLTRFALPRLSRMVKHPVVAAVTYIVWNFSMRPQVSLVMGKCMRAVGEYARGFQKPSTLLASSGIQQPSFRACCEQAGWSTQSLGCTLSRLHSQ